MTAEGQVPGDLLQNLIDLRLADPKILKAHLAYQAQLARLKIEEDDAAHRRELEKAEAAHRRTIQDRFFWAGCAVGAACLGVIFSGRYSAQTVGLALGILSSVFSAAGGYAARGYVERPKETK